MTDLVARLRSRREFASLDGSRWYTTTGPDRDCAEAAEEIERLRERLRELAAVPAGWQPIETAPKNGRAMFVVQALDVCNSFTGNRPYTTDPYCVWPDDEGDFARWPHPFPPTHWTPLPAAPHTAR